MKRVFHHIPLFMLFLALVVLGGAPSPATAGTSPLVTTDWLAKNLTTSNLVIIDVRTETNYGVGHIPGAVSLPYVGWEPLNEKRQCQLMPTPAEFTKMLRALGVNNSSHVIIYDHGNTASDATKGAASMWILKSMGHEKVSYLDGGFTKWTFEGREIINQKPTPKPGNFTARLDKTKVAGLDYVLAKYRTKDAIFVDARASGQHFGFDKRADVERFGHIPGSINLPAPFLTNAGTNRAPATIKGKKELAAMVKGVGLPADKNTELIVYCNTGQFAGLDYLVLHEILGYRNVSVYDGSMREYGAQESLPLRRFAWGHVTR